MLSSWISVHLFYGGSLDALITNVLDRLIGSLGAGEFSFFFIRHHEGGMHVRLRLRSNHGAAEVPLRELVESHARAFFASNEGVSNHQPSDAMLSFLARREGIPANAARQPDRTILFVPYEFDHGRFGTNNADAVERHFVESSRLVLAALRAGLSVDQRQALALTAVAAAHFVAVPAGVRMNPDSWRVWRVDEGCGSELETSYREYLLAHKDELHAIMQPVINSASGGGLDRLATFERLWLTSLLRLRGALKPDEIGQIVNMCVHLLCNRLGLSLNREGFVRYLAAHTANAAIDSKKALGTDDASP